MDILRIAVTVARRVPTIVWAAAACFLAACSSEAPPRTYTDFMEDSIARDGVIARCNENPEESVGDIECANARRAAATITLNRERERYEQYERESERKLAELRAAIDRRDRAKQAALEAAIAAAEAAYEAQWSDADEFSEDSVATAAPELETAEEAPVLLLE